MNSNVGAQLIKNLTFEVEAIPQDNAIEVKNTTNMTPLNVKVRVRKKEDGPSFVRKGIIAVPKPDHPDSPLERVRLASSDQTIMSFNILMEADLEKKVPKKSKRGFFGICLGVQGDDDVDDVQYMPSTASLNRDSKSDTGIVKLKNVRTIAKPVVADDTSSSLSSRKKDKIFGKCKPGGCLDPPFGEDKYAYQPQPLRHKAPATKIDNTQDLDFPEESSNKTLKQSLKKKKEVEASTAAKVVDSQNDNQDKSILSLYQGEGTAVEEKDSELIITYPPALSSSGLLMHDEKNEKNVVRRTSGARHSKKSFNEFGTEYFSPPRTPRDSKDSSKSEKGKLTHTKEIFTAGQPMSPSPTGFQRAIKKSDSKDLGILSTDTTSKLGSNKELIHDEDPLAQKPLLRTTSSHGLTSELINDLQNEPDKETWDSATTAGLAGLGAVTAGLAGLGIATTIKKESDKPIGRKEKQVVQDTATRDRNIHADEGICSESASKHGTDVTDTDRNRGTSRITNVIRSKNQIETIESKGIDTNIPPQERATIGTSPEINYSQFENAMHDGPERDLVFHDVEITKSSDRRYSQAAWPIHDDTYKDLASRGMATSGGPDQGLSCSESPPNQSIDNRLPSKAIATTDDSERGILRISTPTNENIDEGFSCREMAETEKSNLQTGRLTNDEMDSDFSFKGITRSSDLETATSNTSRPTSGIVGDTSSRKIKTSSGLEKSVLRTRRPSNEDIVDDNVPRGMETPGGFERRRPTNESLVDDGKMEKSGGSERGHLPTDRSNQYDIDSDISSTRMSTMSDSKRSLSHIKGQNEGSTGDLASKSTEVTGDFDRGLLPMGQLIKIDGTDDFSFKRKSVGSVRSDPNSVMEKNSNESRTCNGLTKTDDFGSNSQTMMSDGNITANSEAGISPEKSEKEHKFGEITENSESAFPPVRKAMSDGAERDTLTRGKSISGGSDGLITPMRTNKSTESDLASREFDRGLSAIEKTSSEGNRTSDEMTAREKLLAEKFGTRYPPVPGLPGTPTPSWANIYFSNKYKNAHRRISESPETDRLSMTTTGSSDKNQLDKKHMIKHGSTEITSFDKIEGSFIKRSSQTGSRETGDEKRDASVTSDILEQAGRKLSDSGSGRAKDKSAASVERSPNDPNGSEYDHELQKELTKIIESSMERQNNQSRESIFLNLAFQTYLQDNQTAVRTLDNRNDQDSKNVVLIKSLLKSQDKRGVTVPIDSKHVMNIQIKPAPIQERRSKIPKPISKFDSGRSDYSTSTVSVKDNNSISQNSDPHAILSMVFHQELVPLESIIKSLKEDIDSLAAQQMMLTDRIGYGNQRTRPVVYNRKCTCLKHFSSMRMG